MGKTSVEVRYQQTIEYSKASVGHIRAKSPNQSVFAASVIMPREPPQPVVSFGAHPATSTITATSRTVSSTPKSSGSSGMIERRNQNAVSPTLPVRSTSLPERSSLSARIPPQPPASKVSPGTIFHSLPGKGSRRKARSCAKSPNRRISIMKPPEPMQPVVSYGAYVATSTRNATSRNDSSTSKRSVSSGMIERRNQNSVVTRAQPRPVRATSLPHSSAVSPRKHSKVASAFSALLGLSSRKRTKSRAKTPLAASNSTRFLFISEPSSKVVTENFRAGRNDTASARLSELSHCSNVTVANVHDQDNVQDNSTLKNEQECIVCLNDDLKYSREKDKSEALQRQFRNSQCYNTGDIPELYDEDEDFIKGDDDLDIDMRMAIRISTEEVEKEVAIQLSTEEAEKEWQRKVAREGEESDELELALKLSLNSKAQEDEDLAEDLAESLKLWKQEVVEKQAETFLQATTPDQKEALHQRKVSLLSLP